MKVVTSFINAPIPNRGFDWRAYYEGQEESGNYGYGATEEEAVRDLTGTTDLLSAARCALNVLTLLEKEVAALGCNAKNVTENLSAAIQEAA